MYDDAEGKKYGHPCYEAGAIVAIIAGDGPKKPPVIGIDLAPGKDTDGVQLVYRINEFALSTSSQSPDKQNHKVLCIQYPCTSIGPLTGCAGCSGCFPVNMGPKTKESATHNCCICAKELLWGDNVKKSSLGTAHVSCVEKLANP